MVSRIPRARSEINPRKLRNSILMSKLLHGLLRLVSGTKVSLRYIPAVHKSCDFGKIGDTPDDGGMKNPYNLCWRSETFMFFHEITVLRDLFGYFDAWVDVLSLLCSGHILLIWTFVARILLSLSLLPFLSPPFILPQRV